MAMNRLICSALLALLALLPLAALGEEKDDDPFDGRLFAPELIMANRTAIGLTRNQNKRIGELVVAVQQAVAGRTWEMQSAYFELMEVLDEPEVDEERAIALARQAVDSETEIKLEQMRLLIRLRNLLTPEQVAVLQAKRAEMSGG